MTLEEMAKELVKLENEKSTVETKLKSLSDELDFLQTELVSFMEKNQMTQSSYIDGVGICKLVSQVYPRIKDVDKDAVYNAIRAMGEGGMIKTVESIHHKTLQGWVNTRLEKNETLPEGIEIFTKKSIKIK